MDSSPARADKKPLNSRKLSAVMEGLPHSGGEDGEAAEEGDVFDGDSAGGGRGDGAGDADLVLAGLFASAAPPSVPLAALAEAAPPPAAPPATPVDDDDLVLLDRKANPVPLLTVVRDDSRPMPVGGGGAAEGWTSRFRFWPNFFLVVVVLPLPEPTPAPVEMLLGMGGGSGMLAYSVLT